MSNLRFCWIDDDYHRTKRSKALWSVYFHGQMENAVGGDLVATLQGKVPTQAGVYHCGVRLPDGTSMGAKLYIWYLDHGHGIMLRRGLIIRNGDRKATRFATLQLQRKAFRI